MVFFSQFARHTSKQISMMGYPEVILKLSLLIILAAVLC